MTVFVVKSNCDTVFGVTMYAVSPSLAAAIHQA